MISVEVQELLDDNTDKLQDNLYLDLSNLLKKKYEEEKKKEQKEQVITVDNIYLESDLIIINEVLRKRILDERRVAKEISKINQNKFILLFACTLLVLVLYIDC